MLYIELKSIDGFSLSNAPITITPSGLVLLVMYLSLLKVVVIQDEWYDLIPFFEVDFEYKSLYIQ